MDKISENMDVSVKFDNKINSLFKCYKKNSNAINFDFRKFCSEWKWTKRSDVYTHHLHKYPAKLIPYIPIFFLSSSMCDKDDIVLDPFAGSGTVLLESMVHPYLGRNSYGIEINPLARLIAKVKTTPLNEDILERNKVELFSILKKNSVEPIIPEHKNLSIWFSKNAQKKLGKLRACIEGLKNDDYKDFFFACFSSIIRKVALADPNIPPPVILKIYKYKNNKLKYNKMKEFIENNKTPDVNNLFKDAVNINEERINKLNSVKDVSEGKIEASIIWDDSRNPKFGKLSTKGSVDKNEAKEFNENSVGIIITSPPYITAQKYVRTTKLELLWLGLLNTKDLIELDKMTIGSEMTNAKDEIVKTGIKEIDSFCEKITKINKSRAIMVNKYFNDMILVMKNAYRVLKNDKYMVLILGNNKICGINSHTHRLLSKIGENVGFKVELILKDKIRSRGMITGRHKNGGLIENEYIVVLKK